MNEEGILLTVAYDGGAYAGWALQKNAATVAGTLLSAIQILRPSVKEIRGASRTDAGVHAQGQPVAFDAPPGIPPRGWALGLTSHLPATIAIRTASQVEVGYNPRFHSRGKRYIYTLLQDLLRDPFLDRYAWRVVAELDLERMRQAASYLLGTHDFRAYRASADERSNTVRTLTRVDIEEDTDDPRVLRVIVEGDRFLYNMVRILVGTLVDIGAGRRAVSTTASALLSGQRSELGQTAPAHGLSLDEVFLEGEITEGWPNNRKRKTR